MDALSDLHLDVQEGAFKVEHRGAIKAALKSVL